MKFRDADQAVAACARDHLNRGPGSPSIVGHGRAYATRCEKARCRRARDAERAAAKLDPSRSVRPAWVSVFSREAAAVIQRCGYCASPRPWRDSLVFGAHVGAGQVGKPPAAMVRAADLALVDRMLEEMCAPNELGPERARVYVFVCATGRSFDAVALEISHLDVFGRRHWSGDDVARAVRQGRSWMERRLRAARLLMPRQYQPRNGGDRCRTSRLSM